VREFELDNGRYCILIDIPHRWYAKADMALAGFVGGSFVWVPYVNDTLTMFGLGLGVFIAGIRAYKTWRDRKIKD
jgi:hypothetical protein